jgi:hypothetical protein
VLRPALILANPAEMVARSADDGRADPEAAADKNEAALHASVRSANTKPSRATTSPRAQAIGRAKIGPLYTKV